MMDGMSAWRALLAAVRRVAGVPDSGSESTDPAVFWGRVGAYDGFSRHGVLVLIGPDANPGRPGRAGRPVSGGA